MERNVGELGTTIHVEELQVAVDAAFSKEFCRNTCPPEKDAIVLFRIASQKFTFGDE